MYTRHRSGHSTFLRLAESLKMGLFGTFCKGAGIVKQLEFKDLESTVQLNTSTVRRLVWESVVAA